MTQYEHASASDENSETNPSHQPVAAMLTPRGRGAVAVIRFRGNSALLDDVEPAPLFRAADGRPVASQPLRRIVFGHWGTPPAAEAIVLCRQEPDELEISCHGGDAAVRRILDDLAQRGTRIETWRELQRASQGIFETECTEALSRATTARTAIYLLEQQSGTLRRHIQTLKETDWSLDGRRRTMEALVELENRALFGLHLTRPWRVVLAGRPNAGKSSLINALLGYSRSVVFDQPGTTRDVVTAETAFDGWPVQLADTAGIRDDAEDLEAEGISRANARLAEADCRILVLDTSRPFHEDDLRLLEAWPTALRVAHKLDLPNVWGSRLPNDTIAVSSLKQLGLENLSAAVVKDLIPCIPDPRAPIPLTSRQISCLAAARVAVAAEDQAAFRQTLEELLS